MSTSDRERVTIYWYAVPNVNKSAGGWMPVYDHNGRVRGDTYGKGYDLETALAMAKDDARDEAARYIGDWDVVVKPKPGATGTSGTSGHATKHKHGPLAVEKVQRSMGELKRGQLRSGSGGRVTSRAQAQAQREGGEVPPPRGHATMSLDERVRTYLRGMQPGAEIDARGIARALGGIDPLGADYALERAAKAGFASSSDGRWFGPTSAGSTAHATKRKSSKQLDSEIAEALAGGSGRVQLRDRYSGNDVWLTFRDARVVGAMGSDPKRYLGLTVSEARHRARYGGSSHATRKQKGAGTKKPSPPPRIAYRLQLTPSEMQAVEYARGRYAWPDMLSAHVTEGGLVAFTEADMAQWTDDVDSDTEGNHSPFPLASGALADKLQSFYDERI